MTFFVVRYGKQVLFKGGWTNFCELVNRLSDVKGLIFEVK